MIMQGRRVYPHADGRLHLADGDYGFDPRLCSWMVQAPGTHGCSIAAHTVIEHEDKTITVSPSILVTDFIEGSAQQIQWHGYLERGIWREV